MLGSKLDVRRDIGEEIHTRREVPGIDTCYLQERQPIVVCEEDVYGVLPAMGSKALVPAVRLETLVGKPKVLVAVVGPGVLVLEVRLTMWGVACRKSERWDAF